MKIVVKDNKTLGEIQKEFNKEFPYLKIEFFETPHHNGSGSPKSRMYSHSRTVKSCRKTNDEGEISISKAETVSTLEQEFWNKFNLSVQVFRKSGNLWIETTLTNGWTLEQQNLEGREISEHKSPFDEADDLDFTDRDKWS